MLGWRKKKAAFAGIDLVPANFHAPKAWNVVSNPGPNNASTATYQIVALLDEEYSNKACASSSNLTSLIVGTACSAPIAPALDWFMSCTYCSPEGAFASNCQIKSLPTGLCATHIAGDKDPR